MPMVNSIIVCAVQDYFYMGQDYCCMNEEPQDSTSRTLQGAIQAPSLLGDETSNNPIYANCV
jgi:hypothetical protein